MLKRLSDGPSLIQNIEYDEPGVTRFFGIGDIGAKNLISGWAAPEQNHNWNDGVEATLLLTLPARPDDICTLAVEGRAFVSAGVAKQDVSLFVNGYRAGFWRLTNEERFTLEAEIEPEMWLDRRSGALAKCVWHLPDSTRPSDISKVQDHRRIGFCFQSMTVLPRRSFV